MGVWARRQGSLGHAHFPPNLQKEASVRRQASLSLLQHALHRTAAAPLPGEYLTRSRGVITVNDRQRLPYIGSSDTG